jgi:hypothetical protein
VGLTEQAIVTCHAFISDVEKAGGDVLPFLGKHIKLVPKAGHDIAVSAKKTVNAVRLVMPKPFGVLLK